MASHGTIRILEARDHERVEAEASLARVLASSKDHLATAWADAVKSEGAAIPDLRSHLRSLISGLYEVFIDGDWTLTQTVIDGLAQRGVREAGYGTSLPRALVVGRRVIRPFFSESSQRELCDDLLVEALQECVFRFTESYQGLQLASETDRVNTRIIKSLVTALEARDPYTKGHSISVALIGQRVAELLNGAVDPDRAYLAGLLHDVGKVGVPDRILMKVGDLTPEEWRVMQAHPEMGARILQPIRLYPEVVAGVLSHHENYDGSGYPHGLERDEIPLIGRILRIADSFDAMTSTRAHRRSCATKQAIEEILRDRGSCYDPVLVDLFLRVMTTPSSTSSMGMAALQIDLWNEID